MRRQHIRWDLALATVALLGLLAGHGPAGEKKEAPTYATPQAAFEAAKKAAEKNDYRALVGTLTKDNRDAMTGLMVMMGGFVKEVGAKFAKTDDDKAKIKKMEEVLDKHGVTAETAKDAMNAWKDMQGKSPTEVLPALRKLIAPVKDHAGLVAEMMALTDKQKGSPFDDFKNAQLKDVKVEGDTAKGTVTTTKDGQEKTEPIEFRKEGASWRIHIDLDKKDKKKKV